MALTKIVNGIEYTISAEEETRIKAEWAAEAKEYADTKYITDRRNEYPPIGDQLDAILKHLNYMQLQGETNLVSDLDDIVGKWLAVKSKYPKPGS